ncbi:MAG TPA: hypothetical protein VEL47_06625, partial [Myxococcota bacterium]|nr:hypothetical protein [Myxococcota bacterium]
MLQSRFKFLFISVLMALVTQLTAAEPEKCPASDKRPEKVLLDANRTDVPYVDYDKDAKSNATEIVVNEFFKTKDTLFNFIRLAHGTIDSALAKYRYERGLDDRAINIVFKGGNVLRIIAKQALSRLPAEAKDLLEKAYGDMFKRSDLDFNVIVDAARLRRLNYQRTMNDLTTLIYKGLNKVRNEIRSNPDTYFNFLQ